MVRERLEELFLRENVTTLACSAACGADLIALDVARSLDIRMRVILPFEVERFRNTSVTDRPGDWGPLFDSVVQAAIDAGELRILDATAEESQAYAAVNGVILQEALSLADSRVGDSGQNREVLAVVVWEGKSRGEGDLTEQFKESARACDLRIAEILTV